MRKIFKHTFRLLLALVGVGVAGIALLYVPGVQDFALRKALGPVSKSLGMELTVERLRLQFPLHLTIEGIRIVGNDAASGEADTLADCRSFVLDVDPWPLFRGEAVVRSLRIDRLKANYRDTLSGFGLHVAAGHLGVEQMRADLRRERASVGALALESTAVFLRPGAADEVEQPDTTAPLRWAIDVAQLAIRSTRFAMGADETAPELSAEVAAGTIEECRIALESQEVDVRQLRIDAGAYTYLTAPESAQTADEARLTAAGTGTDRGARDEKEARTEKGTRDEKETKDAKGARTEKGVPETDSPEPDRDGANNEAGTPWSIRIGEVALNDNRILYGTAGHRPAEGLDPARLELTHVDLRIDSLYNRGSNLALQLQQLAFRERCGLTVEQTRGSFTMNEAGIALRGFALTTADSHLQADLEAGGGILRMEPATPLRADLQAGISTRDLKRIAPTAIPAPLDNRRLGLHLSTEGTLEELGRIGVELTSPDHLQLTLDGKARYPLDPRRLAASVGFRGELRDPAFLLEILPDTALRRRVGLPQRIALQGSASARNQSYSLSSVLRAGKGRITLDGRLEEPRQRYEATIRCDSFPLGSFLPKDSLGRLDLQLTARGEGFDPLLASTQSRIQLEVDRAEYRGHDFGGLALEAALEEQHLTGRLTDRDSALRLALDLEGRLTRDWQQAHLRGRIGWFDLQALGLIGEPIGGLFDLDAEALTARNGRMAARVALDSIRIRDGEEISTIRPTSAAFATDSASTRAEMQSGDLHLTFGTPQSLDSLLQALPRGIEALTRQIREQRLDMDSLKPALPDFRLQLTAGQNNILNNFLRTKRLAFRRLEMRGANCDSLPLALGMQIEGLTTSGFRIDTVGISLLQEGRRLGYALRVANAPGNLDHLSAAGLRGSLVENTARMELYQRDSRGRTGLRSELDAAWNDSLVRVSLGADPQFGFEPWTVNPGNYLVYRFDRRLQADLDLRRGPQRFALHSLPARDSIPGIRLETAGLGIASMLGLLPAAPPVDGALGADLTLGMAADTLGVRGIVSIDSLTYDRQPFGNLALRARYAQGDRLQAEAHLLLDSTMLLSATASIDPTAAEELSARIDIPGLPLQRLNPLLPADLLRLSGELTGDVRAEGSTARPRIDGGLRFASTALRVPMIGTTFRMAEDTIRIDSSRLRFDRYALLAPNRQPLTIDGEVNLSDPSRMTTDLRLRAADFQLVNVPRKERTTVYGEAYLDLNTSIQGPVDALAVRGRVGLLGGTDINYVMQSSPVEVRQQSQNVVSFVSFRELDSREAFEELPPVRIGGMNMALNVDINSDVKVAVDLSTDGSNRIDLRGGGNLTYTMNPLGDTRLSGRYLLTGGTVCYNPPVIAQKLFRIQPGGYVEWLGDPADPSFNITAVENVRANVSTDGDESRPVNFNISINIRNTLADLSISFDLSAPEDLTMQNQLNSLTAEQRANQAMNLLIYNTYTGPGTTAKVSTENPLNTFIQKELNQWAQNSLKGVDLSFGIDSYGEDDPNGQRTDYSYRLSKNLFSNRIRAVIGGKFSTDADPSQNLRENLIDDISIEYMLDKRDNMYIKLFRHTGYESILEGEITETGVGFVIRKRISRLGDLFRSSKPRTQRTEKQKDHEEDDAR